MLRLSLFIIAILVFSLSFGQSWKRERIEVGGGIGVSNFLGDLGGSGSEGGSYGPRDIDGSSSRYAFSAWYRYYLRRNIAARLTLTYAKVSGDDAESQNPTRQARGLKFRAPVWELSGQVEYYFMSESTKGLYRLKGRKGLGSLKMDGYIFLGIGLFYFNPKGQAADGSWHALQPLGTEGQTSGNGSKYGRIQGCIPMGIGFKKKISRKMSIGLEFSVRMTTTDYLDDVSGKYWEQHLIRDANGDNGDLATYLANPNDQNGWPSVTYSQDGTISEYQQRGDPSNNDTYMFGLITVNYKLTRRRRSLPKF